MSATQTKEGMIEDLLRDLMEIEYDALSAYEYAMDRLHKSEIRSTFGEFYEEHLHHIRELGGALSLMGRKPPESGDKRRFLTAVKFAIGGLISDGAVLLAMLSNEETINQAYERAMQAPDMPAAARAAIERAREDERQHLAWIRTARKET